MAHKKDLILKPSGSDYVVLILKILGIRLYRQKHDNFMLSPALRRLVKKNLIFELSGSDYVGFILKIADIRLI